MKTFEAAFPNAETITVEMPETMARRDLDGIFYRLKVDGKFDAVCLTDTPWEICERWLSYNAARSPDQAAYLLDAVKHLHMKLRALGDQLDVTGE